jgi:dTDP-4-dehydrorhamnose reductase
LKSKILILGANGQLGSDLIRRVQSSPAKAELLPVYRRDLDVSDLDAIPRVLSQYAFDVLINCTSYHKTDEVENRATEAMLINAHAVRALAQVCKVTGARFVHVSTDYVFGGERDRPYVETDCARPLNVYGASKLLGENLALREHAESTLIVRVASLFGVAGASGKGGNFVETMLRMAKEKRELRVVNDVSMSPTSTADAADVTVSLLERGAPPGIYHIVNSGGATWFEFAQQIIRQVGMCARVTSVTSEEFPTVAVRPRYSVLDNSKAGAIVGAIPSWDQALERYLKAKGHLSRIVA